MGHGINDNDLDPRHQQIVDIINKREKGWFKQVTIITNLLQHDLTAEQLDHAFQDIEYTFERRMVRKKKWFGLF